MNFENEFQSLAQAVGQSTTVEDFCKSIKEDLMASSDGSYGWTKRLTRHRVTWW